MTPESASRQTAQPRVIALPLVFLLCLAVLPGCGSVKDTFKETQRLYGEYVEPSPEIDLEEADDADVEDARLARLIMPVDTELERMARSLDGLDTFPGTDGLADLARRFPWLAAAQAVDTKGSPLAQTPDSLIAPIDPTPLLAAFSAPASSNTAENAADSPDSVSTPRTIAVSLQQTDFGSMLVLGYPFFKDNDWKGLTLLQFDPSELLSRSPEPEQLILLAPVMGGTGDEDAQAAPAKIVWTGADPAAAQLLAAAQDWPETLRDDSGGVLDTETGANESTFRWVARYLGSAKLVYATPLQ